MGDRERGRRLYDWWSRHPWLLGRLYDVVFLGRASAFRGRAIQALGLELGETVLELGCGPGNSFRRLRARVGRRGTVVGVDTSRGMLDRAATRIRRNGWDNVHVVRGDAARPGVASASVDAVFAAMSITAMSDPDAVIEAAYDALRPGGRMVVLDARPFQCAPWTLLNPVVVPVSKWLTDWKPERDVERALKTTFDGVTTATVTGGAIFIATATKRDPTDP